MDYQYATGSVPAGQWQGAMEPTEETSLVGGARLPKKTKLKLPSEESVYGAMLYLPPISRLKNGTDWSRPARLAILLCIMNAVLQLGVVRVLDVYGRAARLTDQQLLLSPADIVDNGNNVLAKADAKSTEKLSRSQMRLHRSFLPPNEKMELDSIHDIDPLCKRIGNGNGTFTCMPQSVQFAFEWEHLDTDEDGIWTHEEARADANNLKERIHVSPETIFNNLINGLRYHANFMQQSQHNETFFLSLDVEKEHAIPKAYFNFWKGDAMMCGLFDSNSCEAAAKSGVFDAALVPGRMSSNSKGIHDLDSAIQYCYRMLQPGGGCDALLPTDFKRNREQRWGRCGARSLTEGGKYVNPYDREQRVHVLEASYAQVNAYQRATSSLYQFFLVLVIILWLLALVDEWRELLNFGEFLFMFPGLSPGDQGGSSTEAEAEDSDDAGEMSYKITAISRKHRAVLVLFYIIRVMVCIILTVFGTTFLLDETDYLNLVMNSLALTFILQIDSMLFELLEKDVKDSMENSKAMEFETRLPTNGWSGYFLKKECWGLFFVPAVAIFLVLRYNYQTREPILTVLRCACTQEGEKCLDSMRYQAGWWQNYWSKVLPAAIHQIEALRFAEMNGN